MSEDNNVWDLFYRTEHSMAGVWDGCKEEKNWWVWKVFSENGGGKQSLWGMLECYIHEA